MEKQKAIEKLKRQQSLIEELKGKNHDSPEFDKWMRDTDLAIKKIFGDNHNGHLQFINICYHRAAPWTGAGREVSHTNQYWKGLEKANTLLQSFIKEIEEYWPDEITEQGIDENAQPSFNAISIIENICEKFHLVVRQLKVRHDNRQTLVVEDEYDAQDLLHSLLTLHFDDIRPEEWTPDYAGGCSRMDFLLKQEQIVVEVKKTRKTLKSSKIGEELIVDIAKYKTHPDCTKLICFVYDPERWITNPRGIEHDLNSEDGELPVKVLIRPR
jgi:hypothetical protein